jgi:uncharacterized protein
MRMEDQRQSENIEDRRSSGGGGGGMPGISIGGGGVGIGTIIIAFIAAWIFGINPFSIIGAMGGGDVGGGQAQQQQPSQRPQAQAPGQRSPAGGATETNDPSYVFVRKVLGSTEDVWRQQMRKANANYRDPKLVVFRGATRTACGVGQSAMGPFYCPGDQTVYLDLNFFDTMRRRLGSPGDFAQAYVVAHEVGHHVQQQLGITDKVDAMRGRVSEAQMNALSVRVELMADCLAGVWAHQSQKQNGWRLEDGDVEEALNAAAQIGDDNMQRQGGGMVVPESFTHGSSQQRMTWLKRGLQTGSLQACMETFQAQR